MFKKFFFIKLAPITLLMVAGAAYSQETSDTTIQSIPGKEVQISPRPAIEHKREAAEDSYPSSARLDLLPFSEAEEARIQRLVAHPTKEYVAIDRNAELTSDNWIRVSSDGEFDVWQAHIYSPSAQGLQVFLSDFALGENMSVKVYGLDNDDDMYVDEYTGAGLGDHGRFWSLTVPGDTVVIEHWVPSTQGRQPDDFLFKVTRISHTFKGNDGKIHGISGFMINEPKSSHCSNRFRNSVCSRIGDTAVANASRAVARYTVAPPGGAGPRSLCTGTLINNGGGSNTTLYFLTAWHCIEDAVVNSEARKGTFFNADFEFQAHDCGGTTGRAIGARFIAGHRRGDYALLRIESWIAGRTTDLLLLGWDASDHDNASVFSVHHADGTNQNYSAGRVVDRYYLESFTPEEFIFNSNCNSGCSHYRVSVSAGGTKSGASGSALLLTSGRINGVLSGGSGCEDSYSRFSKIYDDGRVRSALEHGNAYFQGTAGLDDSARPEYGLSPPPSSGGGGGGGATDVWFLLLLLLLLPALVRGSFKHF